MAALGQRLLGDGASRSTSQVGFVNGGGPEGPPRIRPGRRITRRTSSYCLKHCDQQQDEKGFADCAIREGFGRGCLHLTLDSTPECMLGTVMTSRVQIGEAARRTALTVDTIRFYERRELLPKPVRTEGRFRLYSEDDLLRIQFIREMQGLGFSLNEIRQLLHLRARKIEACGAVRDLLETKLRMVRTKIQDLQKLERALTADLRKCNRELKHRRSHKPCACPVLEGEHQ
jgi:DNA-binding transcriptional MerR regulator